jgi:hypothetical protein
MGFASLNREGASDAGTRQTRQRDYLLLGILVVAAVVFYALTINRSEYLYILRADEGYSFAAAVRTGQGLVPQKDFSYAYGPLMPYVYAAGFKLFGVSISTMRGIWAAAYIGSLILFYLLGRQVIPRTGAFILAFSLIGQIHTPLYSYNHVGLVIGIELQLLALMSLIRAKRKARWLYLFGVLFLIELFIKFNEAIAVFAFLSVAAALWFLFQKDESANGTLLGRGRVVASWCATGFVPLAAFGLVTFWLNHGLSQEQVLRNFPILPEYHASIGGYQYVWKVLARPFHLPISRNAGWRWYGIWYDNYYYAIIITLLAGISAGIALFLFSLSKRLRSRMTHEQWNGIFLGAVSIAVYHEFFLTGNHWSTPMYLGFSSLFLFWIVFSVARQHPAIWKGLGTFIMVVSVASNLVYLGLSRRYFSDYFLNLQRANIYSSSDSDSVVISQVVRYLQSNTPPDAMLAAFPHDSLLIHLSERRNALRDDDYQWMLFPSALSDGEVCDELDRSQVRGVLISNFMGFKRGKFVVFGVDYLTHTADYLHRHYHAVKTFPAGQSGYSVTYYERNDSLISSAHVVAGGQP